MKGVKCLSDPELKQQQRDETERYKEFMQQNLLLKR
jgi:hypothetical protein